MFDLVNLLVLALAGLVAIYWWQSGPFKGRAKQLASEHCRQQNLQLLDQSMVITGLWPARNADGNLVFRRTYQFEFSSTGDRRYRGKLILQGMALQTIWLEPYKLPDSD